MRRGHCQAELYFSDILIRSHSDIGTGEFLVPGNDILMLTAGLLGNHFGASISSGRSTWELNFPIAEDEKEVPVITSKTRGHGREPVSLKDFAFSIVLC